MISIDRAKKLIKQGDINKLMQEAEKYIDRVIEREATATGKLDFIIFEEPEPGSHYFESEFSDLRDTLQPIQVETYRKRIVKAYRDEGYNAEYEIEEKDNGYHSYCFEIHGFLKKDKQERGTK